MREIPTATGGVQGGVGLVMREITEGWDIDSTQLHRPNVARYETVLGIQWTRLIGAYLPLTTLEHLCDLKEKLNHFPGGYPIVMEDLYADVGHMDNP